MRLFILGLCCICINQKILSASNNFRAEAVANKTIESKEFKMSNEIERNIGFMDINTDCQLLILEMLQMSDLMSLADANKGLEMLVKDILRRKFVKKTVVFRSVLYSPIMPINYIQEFPDRVEAKHVLFVKKILEKFGHLILHLDIYHEYTLWRDVATDIFRAVNFYCADTLIKLHISNWNDILMQFKKPFKNVEYLSLEGNFYQMSNSNLTFREMFPSIRHFSLRHLEFANATFLEYNYPYLNHVTAVVWSEYQPRMPLQINEMALRKLFENNPQIRSLTLKFPATNLLQMITEKLPMLEQLELEYFQDEMVEANVKIHFANLKKLIVNREPALANLILGYVEEFETNSLSREWVDLVNNEKSLRKLRINRLMDDSEVLELANIDTNLTEVYLQCGSDVQVENLVKLIESNEYLKNFYIKMHPTEVAWNESNIEVLQEKFAGRWIVKQAPFNIELTRADQD